MTSLPSATYATSVCSGCHESIATRFAATLHADTRSISDHEEALILERTDGENLDAVKAGLDRRCGTCHVSGCGDCHVSRPQQADGGFVNGHVFSRSPNSVLNCTACHGSRIEKEYYGKGTSDVCSLTADAHWSRAEMACVECHDASWIHGDRPTYRARYENPDAPTCERCHPPTTAFMAIDYHSSHVGPDAESAVLQCQVCHAQDYNNCVGCHVAEDDKGIPYSVTASSYFGLKIGRNYAKSADRPWDYIVVRRIPVSPDTFDFYGENALPAFDAVPTYKYATPHSISRTPRQSRTCEACHDDSSVFLTPADLESLTAEERRANARVAVER